MARPVAPVRPATPPSIGYLLRLPLSLRTALLTRAREEAERTGEVWSLQRTIITILHAAVDGESSPKRQR